MSLQTLVSSAKKRLMRVGMRVIRPALSFRTLSAMLYRHALSVFGCARSALLSVSAGLGRAVITTRGPFLASVAVHRPGADVRGFRQLLCQQRS